MKVGTFQRLLSFYRFTFGSPEAFYRAMLQKDDSCDLFFINSDEAPLRNMIKKGYLYELSQDAGLDAWAKTLYPAVQSAVCKDGRLYALPIALYSSSWLARRDVLGRLGLEAPDDFIGYCRFLEKWNSTVDDEARWLPFPQEENPKEALLRAGYDLYVQQRRGMGEKPDFDSPLFRSIMQSVLSLFLAEEKDRAVDFSKTGEGDAIMVEVINHKGIYDPFMERVIVSPSGMSEWILPMRADSALPPFHKGRLMLLAINPYSKNKERAMEYLSAYAECMSFSQRLVLTDMEAKDIENPQYENQVRAL